MFLNSNEQPQSLLMKMQAYCYKNENFLLIPMQAKRVEEFIEIRHKKNLPTHILSTLGCL